MTVDEWIRVLQELTGLIQGLAWPLLFLFALIFFRDTIRTLFTNLSEFSLKAGGVEATVTRHIANAAKNVAAASDRLATKEGQPIRLQRDAVAEALYAAVNPRTFRRLRTSRILWVDDTPSNNLYEKRSMEALGIGVDVSTSTENAVEHVTHTKPDLIISDMSRPGDSQAGYTLAQTLRQAGNTIPFVIYTKAVSPEQRAMATTNGVCGITSNPQELLELVISGIQYGC